MRDTDYISINSAGKLLLLLCISEKQSVQFPQCQQQPSSELTAAQDLLAAQPMAPHCSTKYRNKHKGMTLKKTDL